MSGEIIHGRKFANGRTTPEQVHSDVAFPPGARCLMCSKRPMTRVIVMIPLDEALKADPTLHLYAQQRPMEFLQMVVKLTTGPHLRVKTVYACKTHSRDAERAVAKAPSWAVVEVNRGPGEDKPTSGWTQHSS